MATTYTVVKGDTLWAISQKYNTTVAALVELNDIPNPDSLVIGQVLTISGTASATPTNNTSRAIVTVFGLQSNSDSTLYAAWSWDKESYTENYEVKWQYDTGDTYSDGSTLWFSGNDGTVDDKQSTYSIPSNAIRVRFMVKPVSKTKGESGVYFTANWSTEKIYNVSDLPPVAPSTPTVTVDKYKITATLSSLSVNADYIQFQVVSIADNKLTVIATSEGSTIWYATDEDEASKVNGNAGYSCYVDAGGQYQVRARSKRGSLVSAWSDYSSIVSTIPSTPNKFISYRASSETSVYLEWSAVASAETYDIEYATQESYFDGSDQTTSKTGITTTHFDISGLGTGEEYFFRVRAVNKQGESSWSSIVSVVVGSAPAAPTTWASSTTVISGEDLTLYWVHNAEDGSSQTYAELELYIDGVKETHTLGDAIKETSVIKYTPLSEDDNDDNKTHSCSIYTSSFVEGTVIQWRVRTAGITKSYGDWSVQRTIDIYAPPTLALSITDVDGNAVETLTSFPLYIKGLAGPNTQAPISYHLAVTSNSTYETADNAGNAMVVTAGQEIYSKHFDTSDVLVVELSAGNIDLENNVIYTVTCTVAMNSGLTATALGTFKVAWSDEINYEPNAEISINKTTVVANIRPYCMADGALMEDISLSVYRREFDGTFTEIATGLDNMAGITVTDPHPALDFARYRIVAKTNSTGAISYCDLPGYLVGEKAIILQWEEQWSNFDVTDDAPEQPTWAGSLLRLPYNVDVSEKHSRDTAVIEYIGRKHPVSYYGTQLGETATWNTVVPKSDKETIYALRRLTIWMGDVYVREPSGCGYWAQVSVSFSQKHREVTIPVTIEITRVEGGV